MIVEPTSDYKIGFNDYQLLGKTALATGVSRSAGIGASVARALAASGANVFTTYYRPYDSSMPWGSAPFKRVGKPEDAMHLILFLASAQAEYAVDQLKALIWMS